MENHTWEGTSDMPDFLTPGRRNLRGLAWACVKICDGPAEGDEFDSLCQDVFTQLTMVYMLLAKAHHRAIAEQEELAEIAAGKNKIRKTAIGQTDAFTLKRKIKAAQEADPKAFAAALRHYMEEKEDDESVPVNGDNWEDCPECKGRGTMVAGDGDGVTSCDNCDGSGKLCSLCDNPASGCTCGSEE